MKPCTKPRHPSVTEQRAWSHSRHSKDHIWTDSAGGDPSAEQDEAADDEAEKAGGDLRENEEEPIFEEDANQSDANDTQEDVWTMTRDCVIRHHRVPRTKLYTPDQNDDCPFPLAYIDVTRTTVTDCEHSDEGRIYDVWDGKVHDHRELSQEWTDMFDFLRPAPPLGHEWSMGDWQNLSPQHAQATSCQKFGVRFHANRKHTRSNNGPLNYSGGRPLASREGFP